jgi:methylthioribose-1-phosphate isomerase
MAVQSLQWSHGSLRILDQTRLPAETVHLLLERWQDVVEAVQKLRVRGAPAIGVAGAYGVVLAAQEYAGLAPEEFWPRLGRAARKIAQARPTAVNLGWAVERTMRAAEGAEQPAEALLRLQAEAEAIHREDAAANERIGKHGAALIPRNATVLTHCNTGSLATCGIGTALGIVRTAWAQGRVERVIATETRPLLQGARLTAWELGQDGIPVTLIVDGAAAHVMRQDGVAAVIVGADRIAANGDVANKIGTYGVALAASRHGIPFYVASPVSTIDVATPTGADIPIETRSASEVMMFGGAAVAPESVDALNLAFDVTPADLVSAIITERGVARPPYEPTLRAWTKREKRLDSFGSDGVP